MQLIKEEERSGLSNTGFEKKGLKKTSTPGGGRRLAV